jgi:ribosomal protein S18 acetylase RimI-like enzyme
LVSLSEIDRGRFGVITARATLSDGELPANVLGFCRAHGVELLIVRCAAHDYAAVHEIEREGGILCDTLVYYARDLERAAPAGGAAGMIRSARPEDAARVRDIAREAFSAYLGHYHTDPRLDRASADETYADWAWRSCTSPGTADEVLVAEASGRIEGFLTLRRNSPEEAEIVLNAVATAARRSGVYTELVKAALRWAADAGAGRVIVSTQLTNQAVQRAWTRAGFELTRSFYTFHLWF